MIAKSHIKKKIKNSSTELCTYQFVRQGEPPCEFVGTSQDDKIWKKNRAGSERLLERGRIEIKKFKFE